jgi:cytochrome c556
MIRVFFAALILALPALSAVASDDPVHERHEMMEGVKDAAGVIGGMIKGEKEFDSQQALEALFVWQKASVEFGHLFPEGTYTGDPETARQEVWTDREGFDELLRAFADKVDLAIQASPQSPEELGAVAGPAFDVCKKCHEGYRLEDD